MQIIENLEISDWVKVLVETCDDERSRPIISDQEDSSRSVSMVILPLGQSEAGRISQQGEQILRILISLIMVIEELSEQMVMLHFDYILTGMVGIDGFVHSMESRYLPIIFESKNEILSGLDLLCRDIEILQHQQLLQLLLSWTLLLSKQVLWKMPLF